MNGSSGPALAAGASTSRGARRTTSTLPPPPAAVRTRLPSRTGGISRRDRLMHDPAGPSTSKAVLPPTVNRAAAYRQRSHTSSGGAPTIAIAPAAITVQLIPTTEPQREADWNPELYYTAAEPTFRTHRVGKRASQPMQPSPELIGMLPVRDRGYRGLVATRGPGKVTVEVTATASTLERAAAAIAFSCMQRKDAKIASSGLLGVDVVRRQGKVVGSGVAGGAQVENKMKGKKGSKKRSQPNGTAADGSKPKAAGGKVQKAVPKGATHVGTAMLHAKLASALKPGEAARAFVFEATAAAVAMHEERQALLRVLGQAETLQLSHTTCIST